MAPEVWNGPQKEYQVSSKQNAQELSIFKGWSGRCLVSRSLLPGTYRQELLPRFKEQKEASWNLLQRRRQKSQTFWRSPGIFLIKWKPTHPDLKLSKANIDVEEFVERFKKPTKPIGWYGKDDKFRKIVVKALSREAKDRFVSLLSRYVKCYLSDLQAKNSTTSWCWRGRQRSTARRAEAYARTRQSQCQNRRRSRFVVTPVSEDLYETSFR